MDLDTLAALCRSLAKAYSTGVRLYRGAEPLTYCSVYPLNPDPAGPYIPKILECGAEVGIITTPAYQFYGFLTVEPELRVILGPAANIKRSPCAGGILSISPRTRWSPARAPRGSSRASRARTWGPA